MDRSTAEDRLHREYIDGLDREAGWVVVSRQSTGWAVLLLGPHEDTGEPDTESHMRIALEETREDAEYLAEIAGAMIGDIIAASYISWP